MHYMLLHNLLSRFKKEAHHWTTHSILETYADPYCHHCGDFGFYVLWCCVPALKLCDMCVNRPHYRFIKLSDGLATYGYKAKDVATLPILSSLENQLFPSNTLIIMRYMLMPPSERNGTTPMADLDHYYPKMARDSRRHWTMGNTSLTGCVKLSRTFNAKSRRWLDQIVCGHCDLTFQEEVCWLNSQRHLDVRPQMLVPRSYENLHEHISRRHPYLLDYFVEGWEALPSKLRDAFELQGEPGSYPSLPPFSALMPHPGLPLRDDLSLELETTAVVQSFAVSMQRTRDLADNGRFTSTPRLPVNRTQWPPQPLLPQMARPWLSPWLSVWTSWTEFVASCFTPPLFPFHKEVDFITSKMEHAGSIFGLPAMPDGYNESFATTDIPEGNAEYTAKMEHPGSIYDFLAMPDGDDESFETPDISEGNAEYKKSIAQKVLLHLLEKVKSEVWEKMKSKIEEEGIGRLMPLLQGEPIFGENGFDMDEFLDNLAGYP